MANKMSEECCGIFGKILGHRFRMRTKHWRNKKTIYWHEYYKCTRCGCKKY